MPLVRSGVGREAKVLVLSQETEARSQSLSRMRSLQWLDSDIFTVTANTPREQNHRGVNSPGEASVGMYFDHFVRQFRNDFSLTVLGSLTVTPSR